VPGEKPHVLRDEPESVADVGEFDLIRRLATLLPPSGAVAGIGDDTAAIEIPGDEFLLATIDAMVQGVHFENLADDPRRIGRRLLAANLSDIAAMGGRPTDALISLALNPETLYADVAGVYEGIAAMAAEHHVTVVGGNVTRTPGQVTLDLVQLGLVIKQHLVRRSGARPGHVLAVTGSLGAAAAERLLASADVTSLSSTLRADLAHAADPAPRLAAGQALAEAGLARAMIDISDGLAGDVRHLAEASGVGLTIEAEALPVSNATVVAAAALGINPHDLVLSGGEDFELLVALHPEDVAAAQHAAAPLPLTVIGSVEGAEDGIGLRVGGKRVPLTAGGWEHF
jgi:thiamine-monophosphate kinase